MADEVRRKGDAPAEGVSKGVAGVYDYVFISFSSPFSDSSRVRQAGRVRMTGKVMSVWFLSVGFYLSGYWFLSS